MSSYDEQETDRQNVVKFATKIIEAQEEPNMKFLKLVGLASESVKDPTDNDEQLINAVVSSGLK